MHQVKNWDDLRYLLAVARHGTLGAAARVLSVNQSTVFRRIRQLEGDLGVRLFDRMPRGYALTAVGEEVVVTATQVEDSVLALDRQVLGADRALRGVVRLTTVTEILRLIGPHLRRFRDLYPGIGLDVNTEVRLLSLARREADVALRPGPRPTESDVVARALADIATAAYAAPGYLEKRSRPRGVNDLYDHDLIGFDRGRQNAIATWLSGLPDARVIYRSDSIVGQLEAVIAGLGIGFLPCFVGDSRADLRRLFAVDIATDKLWLLLHADLRQTARVRVFVDFIAAALVAGRSVFDGSAGPVGASEPIEDMAAQRMTDG